MYNSGLQALEGRVSTLQEHAYGEELMDAVLGQRSSQVTPPSIGLTITPECRLRWNNLDNRSRNARSLNATRHSGKHLGARLRVDAHGHLLRDDPRHAAGLSGDGAWSLL